MEVIDSEQVFVVLNIIIFLNHYTSSSYHLFCC